jgi:hypothetical protein
MGRSARRKQEERQRGKRNAGPRPVSRHRKKWIVGTLLALVASGAIAAWWSKGTLWASKVAPSFTLQASNGQLVSLKDYLGKQEVVIIFYMGAG